MVYCKVLAAWCGAVGDCCSAVAVAAVQVGGAVVLMAVVL